MINEDYLREVLGRGLSSIEYPARPSRLYRPVEYTLESPGKRLRPLLVLASCQAAGGNPKDALPQALAIEMFHNFTLIHDDVMDRSIKRRGRPTVYHRWGDVQAILSGDALLTMATQYAVKCPDNKIAPIMQLFNKTAMEVYEGQQYDMDFEKRPVTKVCQYMEMIRLKTSVLLGCACATGAIMADADNRVIDAFYNFGVDLGLAFQLRDDWLDVYGNTTVFGKANGVDIVNDKQTWLQITAKKEAPADMEAAREGNPGRIQLLRRVRKIYDRLDLSGRCQTLIEEYASRAVDRITTLEMDPVDLAWFKNLADKLSSRDR